MPSTNTTSLESTSTTRAAERGLGLLPGDVDPVLRRRQASSSTSSSFQTPLSASAESSALSTNLLKTNSVPSKATVSSGASHTKASTTAATASVRPGADTLLHVGPYECSPSVNLTFVIQILASHLESTDTNLNATIKYLTMNLHVAAPGNDPDVSPKKPLPDEIPKGRNLLSSVLSSAISDYLYTPQDLLKQRAHLNTSWYNVVSSKQPALGYFQVNGDGGHTSTPNGWPSESYAEMDEGKRLFAGYGHIDPQIQGYNFSADASTIFPEGYIERQALVATNAAGEVQSGCFFHANDQSVGGANNTWAAAAVTGSGDSSDTLAFQSALTLASNLTYCGISPILNRTLNNVTADEDFRPYEAYVQSTIWSWASGEPRNRTRSRSGSTSQHRCAALNAASGHWQTENCDHYHRAACQYLGRPYKWAVSYSKTPYGRAGVSCEAGTEFTAPRTSLENTYLLHKWRASGVYDNLLWVNFNDLDAKGCWVQGQNSTCPYTQDMNSDREVIVPTVAAVLVFVLTALTVFVKCAANRRRSKRRRRRGDDGWDYEGVPS